MPLAKDTDVRFGKHDDGDEGVILTKIKQGDLVRIPVSSVGSFGTSGAGVTSSFSLGAAPSNPDGTGNSVSLTVPNGQLTAIAWYETVVWGPQCGLRYLRNANATQASFAMIVDASPTRIKLVSPKTTLGTISTNPDYEGMVMVADDLGPGPHVVRIALYGDPTGTGTRSINIFGILADKSHAYVQPSQLGYFPSSGISITVPTAATAIPFSGRVNMIHFYKAGSVTRTVTLKRGSSTYAVITLAAGASQDVTFPIPISLVSWTWNIDAGTEVAGWTLTGGQQA